MKRDEKVEDLFKVVPVGVPPINDDLPDRIPRRYHCSALIGCRGAGKTNLLVHLVNNFYQKTYSMILILSPNAFLDPTFKSLRKHRNVVFFDRCSNKILHDIYETQKERFAKGGELLLILDDFGVNRNLGKMIDEIAARSRHLRLQFIMSAQYFRNLTPVFRNNVDQMLIWRLSDKEFQKVAEDIPSVPEAETIAICKEATSVAYQFLFINFKNMKDPDKSIFSIGF